MFMQSFLFMSQDTLTCRVSCDRYIELSKKAKECFFRNRAHLKREVRWQVFWKKAMCLRVFRPHFLRLFGNQGVAYKLHAAKDILHTNYAIAVVMAKQGLGEIKGTHLQQLPQPAAHTVTEYGDSSASDVKPKVGLPGFLLKQMGGSPKPNFNDFVSGTGRIGVTCTDLKNPAEETCLKSSKKQAPEEASNTHSYSVCGLLMGDGPKVGLTGVVLTDDKRDYTQEDMAVGRFNNEHDGDDQKLVLATELDSGHESVQVTQDGQNAQSIMMNACKTQQSQEVMQSQSKQTVLPASLLAQVTSVIKLVFQSTPLNSEAAVGCDSFSKSSENVTLDVPAPVTGLSDVQFNALHSKKTETYLTSDSTSLSQCACHQNLSGVSCVHGDQLKVADDSLHVVKRLKADADHGDSDANNVLSLMSSNNKTGPLKMSEEIYKHVGAAQGTANPADITCHRKRNTGSKLVNDSGIQESKKKKHYEEKRVTSYQTVSEVLQTLRAVSCGKDDDGTALVSSTETDDAKAKQTISKNLDATVTVMPLEVDHQDVGTSNRKNINQTKKKNYSKKKNKKQQCKISSSSGTEVVSDNDGKVTWDELPQYIPESDSRMAKKKKQSKNKVYDLSALFSGTLGQTSKKPRPNYFLAIQITNPEIKDGLSKVLASVKEADKKLKPAFIDMSRLHITLMVLNLPDEDSIDRTKTGLDDFKQKLNEKAEKKEVEPLTFDVTGLGNFRHQVVFAKVAEGPSLERLFEIAGLVHSSLVDKDIAILSEFNPHITIMKMSKGMKELRREGIKKIEQELYKDFSEKHFGPQIAMTVQLCSMTKPKVNDYYHIEYEVSL